MLNNSEETYKKRIRVLISNTQHPKTPSHSHTSRLVQTPSLPLNRMIQMSFSLGTASNDGLFSQPIRVNLQ